MSFPFINRFIRFWNMLMRILIHFQCRYFYFLTGLDLSACGTKVLLLDGAEAVTFSLLLHRHNVLMQAICDALFIQGRATRYHMRR